jgi:hypothetical protein
VQRIVKYYLIIRVIDSLPECDWPILYYTSNYRSKIKKPSKNTNYNLGKFYAEPRKY